MFEREEDYFISYLVEIIINKKKKKYSAKYN